MLRNYFILSLNHVILHLVILESFYSTVQVIPRYQWFFIENAILQRIYRNFSVCG